MSHVIADIVIYSRRENLRKILVEEIYMVLKQWDMVSGQSDFCEDWLSHSECYLRALKMKGAEPSIGAVAILASRLLNAAEQLAIDPSYQSLVEQLRRLSNRCREIVDADGIHFDLQR